MNLAAKDVLPFEFDEVSNKPAVVLLPSAVIRSASHVRPAVSFRVPDRATVEASAARFRQHPAGHEPGWRAFGFAACGRRPHGSRRRQLVWSASDTWTRPDLSAAAAADGATNRVARGGRLPMHRRESAPRQAALQSATREAGCAAATELPPARGTDPGGPRLPQSEGTPRERVEARD